MSATVYRIYEVLCQILARVPVGTNLSLLHLLFALLSGRFLNARGAVFPALASLPLPALAVRRSAALAVRRSAAALASLPLPALSDGRWNLPDLLGRWQQVVAQEEPWVPVS